MKLNKNNNIICTFGSCFAIEIRRELEEREFKTRPDFTNWEKNKREQLVWYNAFSILYEFEKAFGKRKTNYDDCYPAGRFTDIKGNSKITRWQEPSRRQVFGESLENLKEITEELDNQIIDGIKNSDTYIITLGLSEVFKHKKSGNVVCTHPAYGGTRSDGIKLVDFWNLTKEDNLKCLQKICSLVKEHKPNANIIFTVSPIPLQKTFTKEKQSIANEKSKSKLHWAALQVTEEFDNAYYFDSYEHTMSIPPEIRYLPDGRHVTRQTVASVVSRFEDQFLTK